MMFLRINLKLALLFLCIGVSFIIFLWNQCGHLTRGSLKPGIPFEVKPGAGEEIECHINGEYSVSCRKEGDEVYVPFSFLHKYFEEKISIISLCLINTFAARPALGVWRSTVSINIGSEWQIIPEIYGKLVSDDKVDRFEWSHSYSKIYHPKNKYDPRSVFTTFENYNVEIRDRVKCISAVDGVPVSTQWEPQGYYYPTQIAQFGLAHYSKNLTEPEPRRKVIDDGESELAKWTVTKGSSISRIHDPASDSNVIQFMTGDQSSSQVLLKMDHVLDFIMSFDILLKPNSSITVCLKDRENNDAFFMHYIPNSIMISAQEENIYHGIGKPDVWKHLTRDLIIDLQKGFAYHDKPKKKLSRSKFKIVSIILNGHGMVDNITLASSEHMAHFYAAADWFVKNQDPETGGWSIPVRRKLASGFAELKPGWYSAMGQGHAISLLARAAHRSGQSQYLHAAFQALRPFRLPAWQGGVLTTFLGKYVWYEEYPTTPASFVLNGFIYALLGLYDLRVIAGPSQGGEAKALYDQGMDSLKKMLPLYDTGTGSIYDLRHFTLGVTPNIARWDYHATHINLLLLLAGLEKESIFASTAHRWEEYMQGKRAPHN